MDIKTYNATLSEISVVKRLVQEGHEVYLPFNGKTTHDLLINTDKYGLLSVQVKSTQQKSASGGYIVELKSVRSNKTLNAIKKFDSAAQDILAIYIVELDAVIFLKSGSITNVSTLTVQPKDVVNLAELTLEQIMGTLAESA
jgi:hypothetical protein